MAFTLFSVNILSVSADTMSVTERSFEMKFFKAAAVIACGIVASVTTVTAFREPIKSNSAVTAYPLLVAADTDTNGDSVTMLFKSNKSILNFVQKEELKMLIPLGTPFGIKLYTEGVLVVGFSDVKTQNGNLNPCYSAGIRKGDSLLSINGEKISSNENIAEIVTESNGTPLEIKYKRSGAVYTVTVKPALQTDGQWKIGIWIRDSAAGIGTVTFVDPKTGVFGGLGHGICDVDTGKLMPLKKASVYDVIIDNVTAGKKGDPGELLGRFASNEACGDIFINSQNGVYGTLNGDFSSYKAYPVADYSEITSGYATVISTVSGNTPKEYSVRVEKVSDKLKSEKNFIIRITDETLLDTTNGIVQGMSGSPIIQNGKIIGAVTHVLVNDPQKGYGIYIGNMLKTADSLDIFTENPLPLSA